MMEKQANRTILVPYDFSPMSEFSLQHSIQYARILDAEVFLLHVLEDKKLGEILSEKLTFIANESKKLYKIKPSILVRQGRVHQVIKEVAYEINASLVIMKTEGPKGIQRFLKSRAIKVMMGSTVPFIVVQSPPIRFMLKKVVVPIDFRNENKEKLTWISFLTRFYQPEIVLFRSAGNDYRMRNNLKFATKFLEGRNIAFEIVAARGKHSFTFETIEYTKEIRSDLIVVMLSRFITWDKVLFGLNEQQFITNHHKIPVMVLNPKTDLHKLGGFY